MPNLAARIADSFENVSNEPWLSDLTDVLATQEWDRLRREIRLTPANYGTSRFLTCSDSAPRLVIEEFDLFPFIKARPIIVESPPRKSLRRYRDAGVHFYSAREIRNAQILPSIVAALGVINEIPSLMT